MIRFGTRHRPPRHGFTLIETLVAIGMISALVSVCAAALVRMNRQHVAMVGSLADTTVARRMTHDFQSDVHAAQSAQLLDEGARLVLQSDREQTTWWSSNNITHRVVQPADEASPADLHPGEKYHFHDRSVAFDIKTDTGAPALIAVATLSSAGQSARVAMNGFSVHAVIGLNGRFGGDVSVKETP